MWSTITDIQGRSQTSYYCIPPRVMVMASLAMGLKLRVYRFFADHKRKNKCVHNLRVLHVYLHALTAVDAGDITHLTNHGYFDYRYGYGKNLKTPNFSPMPGSKWRRFWDLPCTSVSTIKTYSSIVFFNCSNSTLNTSISSVVFCASVELEVVEPLDVRDAFSS